MTIHDRRLVIRGKTTNDLVEDAFFAFDSTGGGDIFGIIKAAGP